MRGRDVPAKDVRTRVRAFVTIKIGVKNEVLNPVYLLPRLPSWSKPLSYRKLPIIITCTAELMVNGSIVRGKPSKLKRDIATKALSAVSSLPMYT